MKRLILVILLIILVLSSCSNKSDKNTVGDFLSEDRIYKIVGTTQMINPPRIEIEIQEEQWDYFCRACESISITKSEVKADLNGWQYKFEIEEKSGKTIKIVFAEHGIDINGVRYNYSGYDENAFISMFK